MKRYIGLSIGPRTPKKDSRFSLEETLEICDEVQKKCDIDGVEIRFNDALNPADPAGDERIPGPTIPDIKKGLKELRQRFGEENVGLHMSEYILNLFIAKRLDAKEFINSFPYVVGHLKTYEDIWSHMVDDSYFEGLLDESSRKKILIEHGYRADNKFYVAAKLAKKCGAKLVLDIGHKWREFYEQDEARNIDFDADFPTNPWVDTMHHYARDFDGPTAKYWYNNRIQFLASNIVEVHIHGLKRRVPIPNEDGSISYECMDHFPLDKSTRTTPAQEELMSRFINAAPSVKRYVVELLRKCLTVKNINRTIRNFRKYIL